MTNILGQAQFELPNGKTIGFSFEAPFRLSQLGNEMYVVVSKRAIDMTCNKQYQLRGYLMALPMRAIVETDILDRMYYP